MTDEASERRLPPVRILIADDEPVALERLRGAVACVPEAELVGSARDGREALQMIRERTPDIVVLDIQMPHLSGLEVMTSLASLANVPEVIFLTAYDQHAVGAFELQAADYLLKPVPFERFRTAVRRAGARLQARSADQRFAELSTLIASLQARADGPEPGYEREFWVKLRDGLARVPVENVDLIEAEGDYVVLHTKDGSHLIKQSISGLEARLDPARFARVHRSTIVNLAMIKTLRRRGKRSLSLVLQSGAQVAVGPSYVEPVLEALNARRWRTTR